MENLYVKAFSKRIFHLPGIGVDDMFVIIQCLDNLDEDLDPKEKVAQVSFQRDVDLSQ